MGGSKWSKVKEALGLRLCALAAHEDGDPNESTVASCSNSKSCSLRESNPRSVKPLVVPPVLSLSGLEFGRSGARSSRSTCAICLDAIKPGHGHALFTAECSHTFHFPCIASNVRYGNMICPVCRAKWNEVPLLSPPATQVPLNRQRRLNSSSWSQDTGWTTESPRQQTSSLPSHEFVLHSSPQEPIMFDDDEPLVLAQTSPPAIRENKPYMHNVDPLSSDEGDSTGVNPNDGSKHLGHTGTYASVKTDKFVGRNDDSKLLFLQIYPELAAIPQPEFRDKFTVLIHLKALSSNVIQHNNHQHDGVHTASAHEVDSGVQNYTHPSESIMGSPLQPYHSTIDRAPIDLVTVLDVSGSMTGTKLALLKRAMGFVIQNLSPADRLAVVAFSSSARRLFPLRHMIEQGRKQALRAVDLLVATGGTNIAEGLRKGAKVLEDRREQNPVSSIMLLSDGQDTLNFGNQWDVKYTNSRRALDYPHLLPDSVRHASQHGVAQIPVHTFGFGSDHDAAAMHAIAEGSGGTFSFVETENIIQDAFAQCIGGLLSVMIQDVQVAITSSNADVQLVAIQAGSYVNNITDGGQQGFVKIGDLYADEERDFLVDVKIPALLSSINGSNCNEMKVINVTCTYRDTISKQTIQSIAKELSLQRPESISMEQQPVSLEVDRQRNRLSTANSIAEARACADRGDLSRAQIILGTARAAVRASPAGQAGDELCRALESELKEIQERMVNMQLYENSGRSYILSAHSSHSRQRATTRGYSNESSSMNYDYKTTTMVDMLMRSQTMHSPHQDAVARTLLPSKSCPLPSSGSSH